MKALFMSSSDFGHAAFLALIENNIKPVAVYTKEPKQKGRGKKIHKTIIHEEANKYDIPVKHQHENSEESDIVFIKGLNLDIIVIVDYGVIVSDKILSLAKYGGINIHPSSLPLFRGATPIERTIMSGAKTIDVCIIKVTEKLDAGNILDRKEFEIKDYEDATELKGRLSREGGVLLTEAVKKIQKSGIVYGKSQDLKIKSSYAKKITKEELLIESENTLIPSKDIINKIRGLQTYGGPYIVKFNKRIKIIKAKYSSISLTDIDITTSDGFVVPEIIKPEGRNVMNTQDFLNGLKK